MATLRRLPAPAPDGILPALARLARLEFELGLSEARAFIVAVAVALASALTGAMALIAAAVLLLAAVPAPFFGVRWEPLVIAGGGVFIVAASAIAWSAWRPTHLEAPRRALASFEEIWRWLGALLRSRLTSR